MNLKKLFYSLLCCTSVFCILALPQTYVHAAAAATDVVSSIPENTISKNQRAATRHITVNVSSADISAKGCTAAIQAALNLAAANATADTPYKIIVAPGSYTLTGSLNIYSNTYLCLDKVTLTQSKGLVNNMLKVGAPTDTQKGYYYKNITIDGGIWNQNGNSNTSIKACHAKNLTIMNATIKNCKNSHLTEFAGVDGLTIKNCTFSNQSLSTTAKVYTYEAIQLDILLESHIAGYLSEDLPLKNVTVTNCTFADVPRGVGSHTAVLNNPVDTITISNNTFTNLKSLAIQAMNYKNCSISNNTIKNCPQGIMVYSIRESGTFLPSTLAAEGGVSTSTSSAYVKPSDKQNITIENNTIHVTGKDPYEKYENTAIFASGLNLSKSVQGSGDKLPAGNHYLSDITISNNTIDTDGHGIRLQDVKSSNISGNTVTYNSNSSKTFYGIQLREDCSLGTISDNKVKNAISGIHIYSGSSASKIANNSITKPKKNGIMIEKSKAGDIANNTVTSPGVHGIFIYAGSSVDSIKANNISGGETCLNVDSSKVTNIKRNTFSAAKTNTIFFHNGCTVTNIESNTLSSIAKRGFFIEASTIKNIKNNTINKPAAIGIHVYKKSSVNNIYGNKIISPASYGISVENSTADTIEKNTISKPSNIGIFVFANAKTSDISNNTITSGKKRGISINAIKTDITVSGNKISKCSDTALYCNPASTKYTITINKNRLTGKSTLDGIRADSGKLIISDNTIQTFNRPIVLSAKVKGTITPNIFKAVNSKTVKVDIQAFEIPKTTALSCSSTKNSVKLKWKKVSNANGYIVYRSASKNGTYKKCAAITNGSTTTYTDKKLKSKTTYYYKIAAINQSDNQNVIISGEISSPKSVKTK